MAVLGRQYDSRQSANWAAVPGSTWAKPGPLALGELARGRDVNWCAGVPRRPARLLIQCGRDVRAPNLCGRDDRAPNLCGRDDRAPNLCGRDVRVPCPASREPVRGRPARIYFA